MNQGLKEIVKQEENRTLAFGGVDAIVFKSFAVDTHFNVVIRCAQPLNGLLSDSIAPLADRLALTDPENYHVTVCTFPLATSKSIIENVKSICKNYSPLTLQIKGLHLRPKGVMANAYSLDGSLGLLRERISKEVGSGFHTSSQWADTGWVTLGRFKSTPSQRTCQYVQSKVEEYFGTFTGTASLLKSNSRQRLGETVL